MEPRSTPAGTAAPEGAPDSLASWTSFYEENWHWIYSVAHRMGGPGIDAEDVTQDVFVVLISRGQTFAGRSAFRTWVYRVVLNVLSEHRRRSFRHSRLARAMLQLQSFLSRPKTASQELERIEALELVHRALDRMSSKTREVFVLREVEELSGDEVSAILEIPAATVRSRLHLARKEFVRRLRRLGVEP